MTEREQAHTSATSQAADEHDDRNAGRLSRSALLRKRNDATPSGLVARKARDANGVAADAGDAVAAASASSGSPLPASLQRKFESSLGADLSGVRVHTGDTSAAANDAVGAKAYTVGNDIHFGAGQYDPGSSAGEHLLAHEVAHTVQQTGTMQFKLAVSAPGDSHEIEADRAADAMIVGQAASVGGRGGGLDRQVAEKPAGPGTGPVKTLSGAAAIKGALSLLKTATPTTVNAGVMGDVTLKPGAAVGDMVLLQAGPAEVYYLKGSDIYQAFTPDFVRDIWLTSLSKGAANAEWLIPLAKAEFALITALLMPTYQVAAMTGLQFFVFCHEHRGQLNTAMSLMQRAWTGWTQFEDSCPTVAKNIRNWGFHQMISNAPKGIELEDLAYFVGRVIGTEGLVGKINKGIEVTVWVFTKVVAEFAFLVSALHAPKIIAKGLEEAIKEKAGELQGMLKKGGYEVALEEAKKMVNEFRAHPESEKMMSELRTSFDTLSRALDGLTKSWKKEMG